MDFHTAYTKFLQAKKAQRLSPHTIEDYTYTYKKFSRFLEERYSFLPNIEDISSDDIIDFLAANQEVTKKTLLNYHTGLSALWTWAVQEGICETHVVHKVPRPKPEKREIVPFTRSEILKLLSSAQQGQHPLRDQALILFLLDTGVRASEAGKIEIRDINFEEQTVLVRGKGSKERVIPFSSETAQAILAYLEERGIQPRSQKFSRTPLFASDKGRPLDRHAVRLTLYRIGNRAGVFKVYPHRFRHTFAIQFLRNGGNVYALQRLLGHSTLDMSQHYLHIVLQDVSREHEKASPVSNWNLTLGSGP